MKMPDRVPVLNPDDFRLGPFLKDPDKTSHRFCLLGWRKEVFRESGQRIPMGELCIEMGFQLLIDPSQKNTKEAKEQAAQVWLAYIQKVGYNAKGERIEAQAPSVPSDNGYVDSSVADTHVLVNA